MEKESEKKIMKFTDLSHQDRLFAIQMEYQVNSLQHEGRQKLTIPLAKGNPLIKSFGIDEANNPVPVVSAVFNLSEDGKKYVFSHVE